MSNAYDALAGQFGSVEAVEKAQERGELSDEAARRIATHLFELQHPTTQLTREDLQSMKPEQIQAAMQAGRLDKIIKGEKPVREPIDEAASSTITMDELRGRSIEEVTSIWRSGRVDHLLGPYVGETVPEVGESDGETTA